MPAPIKLTAVPVDLFGPGSILWSFLTERMLAQAKEFFQGFDPALLVRNYLSRVAGGDQRVRAVAFVNDRGQMVGHMFAELMEGAGSRWLHVWQAHVDSGVNGGETLPETLVELEDWAAAQGATRTEMSTARDSRAWEKRYGFGPGRSTLSREIVRERTDGRGTA